MNIRYVTQEFINKSLWDQCIKKAVNGRVYAYSWYLDIMADNWDALIIGDETYETVFPLTYRSKYGISYLYQPFLPNNWEFFQQNRLHLN